MGHDEEEYEGRSGGDGGATIIMTEGRVKRREGK